MGEISDRANQVYRDNDGGSPHYPLKPEIRNLFGLIDRDLSELDGRVTQVSAASSDVLADVQAAIDAAQAADGDAAVAGALAGQEAAQTALAGYRQPAPGGRTYYVRTDGSNSNNGLSNTAGGAFLTIQKAIDAAYSIDCKGSVVQIYIADGTYPQGLNIYGRLVGAFDNGDTPLRIYGNEASPQNVVISPTGADAIRIGDKATVLLAGVTIKTTTSGNGILAGNYAFVWHRNCRFDTIAGETIATTSFANVVAIGDTTVVGGAQSFVHATNNSIVSFSGRTLTFVGTPTFATYVYGLNTSVVDLSSATIVGKALGGITVHVNSILNVSSCVGIWTGGQAMIVSNGGLISAEDKVGARQFYVRADGTSQNNSGFGNTPEEAFPSIQAAINRLAQMPYDLVGTDAAVDASYDWQINVAAGTFIGDNVALLDTRFSRVTIRGASPSTTIVLAYTSSGTRTAWTIDNQKVGSAGIPALNASDGAQITFKNVTFAASTFFGLAQNGGRLYSSGAFTISGASSAAAFYAKMGGCIKLDNSAVTVTGNPALGTFALLQSGSVLSANGTTFSGSATGTRYAISGNSVVDTNGAATTLFPGNVVGTTATGGQYV